MRRLAALGLTLTVTAVAAGAFLAVLRTVSPGDTETLRVVRDGSEQPIDVTAADRPPASS